MNCTVSVVEITKVQFLYIVGGVVRLNHTVSIVDIIKVQFLYRVGGVVRLKSTVYTHRWKCC
jgi:hypothetical protein